MAKKRLNRRFVAILTLLAMVLMTVVLAGLAFTMRGQRDPLVYKERAEQHSAKGEHMKAAAQYQRAFRIDKSNTDWLVLAAEEYFKAAEIGAGILERGLGTLQGAIRTDPSHIEAQVRLMDIMTDLQGIRGTMEEDAQRLIDTIEGQGDAAIKEHADELAMAYHIRGVARFSKRGDDSELEEQAINDIKKAMELAPGKPEYLLAYANIFYQQISDQFRMALTGEVPVPMHKRHFEDVVQGLKELRAVFDQAVVDAGQSAESYRARGDYLSRIELQVFAQAGLYAQQRSSREQAMVDAYDRNIQQIRVNNDLDAQQQQATIRDLQRRRGEAQTQIQPWRELAEQYAEQEAQRRTSAAEDYAKALELAADAPEILRAVAQFRLANINADDPAAADDTDAITETIGLLDRAISFDEKDYATYLIKSAAYRLLASNAKDDQTRQAYLEQALETLENRLATSETVGLDAFRYRGVRASCLQSSTQLVLQIADSDTEGNVTPYLAKANAFLDELTTLTGGQSPEVLLLQAQVAQREGNINKAISQLRKANTMTSVNDATLLQIRLRLAGLYDQRGDIGAAKEVAESAVRLAPDNFQARLVSLRARVKHSNTMESQDERQAELTEVLSELDQLLHVSASDNLELERVIQELRLQTLAAMDRVNEADEAADRLEQLGAANIRNTWLLQKARTQLSQEQYEGAEQTLRAVLRDEPGNFQAIVLLLDILERTDRLSQGQAVLDRALEADPDSEGIKRLQELLAIEDPTERRQRQAELAAEVRESRRVATEAQVEASDDEVNKALYEFSTAAEKGDMDAASGAIQKAFTQNPTRIAPTMFLFSLGQADWAAAEQAAEQASEDNLDGVDGELYFAELALERGRYVLESLWKQGALESDPDKLRTALQYFTESESILQEIKDDLEYYAKVYALLGEVQLQIMEAHNLLNEPTDAEIVRGTQENLQRARELNPNSGYVHRLEAQMTATRLPRVTDDEVREQLRRELIQHLAVCQRTLPFDRWTKRQIDAYDKSRAEVKELIANRSEDAEVILQRRQARYKEAPDDTQNLLWLAWILGNRQEVQNYDQAEKYYAEALTKNPSEDVVREFMQYAQQQGRQEQVLEIIPRTLNSLPESQSEDGLMALASFHMIANNAEQAEKALQQYDSLVDNGLSKLQLAGFYLRTGNSQKAQEYADKALADSGVLESSQQMEARRIGIVATVSQQNYDDAQRRIDEYRQNYPSNITGMLLASELARLKGDGEKAIALADEVLQRYPSNRQALTIRAVSSARLWNIDDSINSFEALDALGQDSLSASERLLLARLYLERNRDADAMKQMRTAMESALRRNNLQDAEEIRIQAVGIFEGVGRLNQLEQFMTWCASQQPENPGWMFALGQALLSNGQPARAIRPLQNAVRLVEQSDYERNVGLATQMVGTYASALVAANDVSTAQEVLRTWLANLNRPPQLLVRLGQVYWTAGNSEQAKKAYFDGFNEIYRPNTPGDLLMVNGFMNTLLLGTVPLDTAEQWAQEKLSQDNGDVVARLLLAELRNRQGDTQKAYQQMQQIVDTVKDNDDRLASARMIYSQMLLGNRDYVPSVEQLKQVVQIKDDSASAYNNLAFILAESLDKPEEAEPYGEKAVELSPRNSSIQDTYGRILYRLGRYDESLHALTWAVLVDDFAEGRYHLALTMQKLGMTTQARQQLELAERMVTRQGGGSDELTEKIRTAIESL